MRVGAGQGRAELGGALRDGVGQRGVGRGVVGLGGEGRGGVCQGCAGRSLYGRVGESVGGEEWGKAGEAASLLGVVGPERDMVGRGARCGAGSAAVGQGGSSRNARGGEQAGQTGIGVGRTRARGRVGRWEREQNVRRHTVYDTELP